MKTKITLLIVFGLLFNEAIIAQTVLYNFEDGTTQAGTADMAWSGAAYLKAFGAINNPLSTGINTTAKVLRIQEEGGIQWWNNSVIFSLTNPITINSSNRYLHIKHLRPRISGGGFIVSLNAANEDNKVGAGANRFDSNLSATNTWQDIVIDLNTLITNNTQLSNFEILIDLNDWNQNAAPLGDYLFDEIILSNSPLPRGTTFLTGNNLYDFETGTASNITGVNTSSNADNPVAYPVTNPMSNAKNATANVGKRSVIASPQWWTGFSFSFSNPVQVDATHKYLHILVSVPVDGQKIALDVKQGATNVISDGVKTITTANVWQDVVYDVSSMAYISGLSLKMGNWDATAVGDYYFDEIYIDDSATPRTDIGTGIASPSKLNNILVSGKTITISNNGHKANVTIFNANGQVVASKNAVDSEQFEIKNAGLYIVKNGADIVKVMVR